MTNENPIVERCQEMSTKELLRATTVEGGNYEPAFHAAAHTELSRRGMEAYDVRTRARLILPDGSVHEYQVDEIPALLPPEVPEGTILGVENCIDDMLVLQQRGPEWVAHHTSQGTYHGSWVCPSHEVMQSVIRRFLSLEEWRGGLEEDAPLNDWLVVEPSCSIPYARRAMEALEENNIAARAVPEPVRCGGMCFGPPRYSLMVEGEEATRAREILDGFTNLVARLHEDAEAHGDRGETEAELATYEEILILAPGDQIALFNKGSILMELKRYDEAVETLAPLASAADEETLEELSEYFTEILRSSPSIPAFHAMADLERRRGEVDSARHFLEQALNTKPEDPLTHLALAYLCYEDEEYDTTAAFHFRRYLELVPDADDRETVEAMIDDLESRG